MSCADDAVVPRPVKMYSTMGNKRATKWSKTVFPTTRPRGDTSPWINWYRAEKIAFHFPTGAIAP